jgi:outer membrane protein assembly factor BamE (lipoprotein component of BamABCDE complex)
MIPSTVTQLGTHKYSRGFAFLIAVASLLLAASNLHAQSPRKSAAAAAEDDSAVLKDYRGVQLGMTADEVRKKLGAPKDKGDEQDFYVFNETETAQVVYDSTHKVITISADFLNPGSSVPTAKQVFGSEVEAKADGSVYRMVRFTKAGYWLSFNRTGGTSPLTTVTFQKIQ